MVQILEETAPPRGRNEYNLIGNRSFILKKQFRLKFRFYSKETVYIKVSVLEIEFTRFV